MISSSEIDPEAYAMLSPDDVLNRIYQQQGSGLNASLFMAYYRTQRKAKTAHDPKVCLPGNGWHPQLNEVRQLTLPDGSTAPVNYYVITKGNLRNVVIYWFQTHKGPAHTEQTLRLQKFFDILGGRPIRYGIGSFRVAGNGRQSTASERCRVRAGQAVLQRHHAAIPLQPGATGK